MRLTKWQKIERDISCPIPYPVSDVPTLFYFGFVLALLFIVPLCFSSDFCKSKSKSNRKDNHYEK